MRLPFSHDQFLDVFRAYNETLWPGAALLWFLTLAALVLLARGRLNPRLAGALLAVHWGWAAVAYHFPYFTRINPAARLFGVLFLLEALLLLGFGVLRADVRVTWGRRWHQILSIGFSASALAYPLLVIASGLRWPRMPSFGVPCPTTLLTIGLLLALEPGRLRALSVIPWLWCLIAGSAALLLGVRPDTLLLLGAVVLAAYVVLPRSLAGPRTA